MFFLQNSVCTSKAHIYTEHLLNLRTLCVRPKSEIVKLSNILERTKTCLTEELSCCFPYYTWSSSSERARSASSSLTLLTTSDVRAPTWIQAQLETGSLTSLWRILFSVHITFYILKCWDVHIINSFHSERCQHVCLLSLQGTALENHLIGIHSQPSLFPLLLFVCAAQRAMLPWHLSVFSFAPLSCGHSPLCGSSDIISFYTVHFMVDFALCFTLRGCFPRKGLCFCLWSCWKVGSREA